MGRPLGLSSDMRPGGRQRCIGGDVGIEAHLTAVSPGRLGKLTIGGIGGKFGHERRWPGPIDVEVKSIDVGHKAHPFGDLFRAYRSDWTSPESMVPAPRSAAVSQSAVSASTVVGMVWDEVVMSAMLLVCLDTNK